MQSILDFLSYYKKTWGFAQAGYSSNHSLIAPLVMVLGATICRGRDVGSAFARIESLHRNFSGAESALIRGVGEVQPRKDSEVLEIKSTVSARIKSSPMCVSMW